jgi:hypothetical protein
VATVGAPLEKIEEGGKHVLRKKLVTGTWVLMCIIFDLEKCGTTATMKWVDMGDQG